MLMIREAIAKARSNEEGATAVEYAIMVALIAAVIIIAVVALGTNASSTFNCTSDSIADQGATDCG